jgi:uncharacterized SAM-binding protein YcdF (DUF218 family)
MNKDAILVIDAGIKQDATLTPISSARVTKAVETYKQGTADKMIMSGGAKGPIVYSPTTETEAQAMKEYAVQLAVPPQNILLEEQSKDLLGNAYFSKKLYLEPSGWKNITVITSGYHAARAEYVFKKILGPDYVLEFVPADSVFSPEENRQLMMDEERKFALAQKWLDAIPDGDSAAIEDFIYHWHPLYAEHKKISSAQMNERAKDY